jgi:cardiolipin synthase
MDATGPNSFTVFTEGDALYEDMLAAIRAARGSVSLESYIFEPDSVGQHFIEALINKANEGVQVRLHLDAFGSMTLAMSEQVERLRAAGISLRWFNRWRWYAPMRFNRRNHRKLLVIDDTAAWLGGFNIHIDNSLQAFGEARWRDTHVRIAGPLVQEAQAFFDHLWDGRRRWRPVWHSAGDSVLVSNHNWMQRYRLHRILLRQFRSARDRVWLSTPYFMPDRLLQREMARAAARGIDVRLIVPFKTDRPMTQLAARAAYGSLLNAGVRIFEYQPRILHTKTAVIDDNWCSIGTANLDYRSFFVNFELNLVSGRRELVEQLSNDFARDQAMSLEVTPTIWAERGLLRRLGEIIGWLARKIL